MTGGLDHQPKSMCTSEPYRRLDMLGQRRVHGQDGHRALIASRAVHRHRARTAFPIGTLHRSDLSGAPSRVRPLPSGGGTAVDIQREEIADCR